MPNTQLCPKYGLNLTGHNIVAFLRGDKIVNDRKRHLTKTQKEIAKRLRPAFKK